MTNTNTIEGSFKHCKAKVRSHFGDEFGSIEKKLSFQSFEKECNFLGINKLLALLDCIGCFQSHKQYCIADLYGTAYEL
jgi:hypothetical protein